MTFGSVPQGQAPTTTSLGFMLDTAAAPKMDDRSDLPDGPYVVVLHAAPLKTSSTGSLGINFEFNVVGGNFDGRKIFEWCTIAPPQSATDNQRTAAEIGKKMLASVADAVGFVGQLTDTRQLMTGRPFTVTIKSKPDKRNAGQMDQNVVKVEALGGQPQFAAPAQQQGQVQQQPAQAQGGFPQQGQVQQPVQQAPVQQAPVQQQGQAQPSWAAPGQQVAQ